MPPSLGKGAALAAVNAYATVATTAANAKEVSYCKLTIAFSISQT